MSDISVPDEISVIGFDDTALGKLVHPALTTIRQDSRERAEKALELLGELKNGGSIGETVKVRVTLVERESVKENGEFRKRISIK